MKITDDITTVEKRGWSNITIRKEGWTEGDVYTRDGIIQVYAQGDDDYHYHSRVSCIHNGLWYSRSFHNKRYTPRGLVTKAKQFMADVLIGGLNL